MAKQNTLRAIQCYHCRSAFEVSARAMTVSCPSCHKKLLVEDVVIKDTQSVTKLQTCGRILIEKNGRVMAQLVEAHQGIEVQGVIEAKVLSGQRVIIGPKAQWKGDCRAPSVQIELGARITRGYFEIDPNPEAHGLTPLPGLAHAAAPDAAAEPQPPPDNPLS